MSDTIELDPGDGAATAMDIVDAMPREMRALVHDYGLAPVIACVQAGVTKPRQIRNIIATVRNSGRGAMQAMPKEARARGASLLSGLDPWLIQQRAGCSGRQVVRMIRDQGYVVVPASPTDGMVHASVAALQNVLRRVDVHEKHKMRLQAALTAGHSAMWDDPK